MAIGGLGQILALVGLILLLVTGVGRQQARRRQQSVSVEFLRWQRWGRLSAFALIGAGLIIMAFAK